jgi:DNA-binding NarL/FixJ family response regulator
MDTTANNTVTESGEPLDALTPRNREILSLVMTGLGNREIAERLDLQYQTVRNYVSQMYRELNVKQRTGLVMWAVKNGYDRPEMIAPWLEGETD